MNLGRVSSGAPAIPIRFSLLDVHYYPPLSRKTKQMPTRRITSKKIKNSARGPSLAKTRGGEEGKKTKADEQQIESGNQENAVMKIYQHIKLQRYFLHQSLTQQVFTEREYIWRRRNDVKEKSEKANKRGDGKKSVGGK